MFELLESVVFTGIKVVVAIVLVALGWGWYRLLRRRERAPGIVVGHRQGAWRRRKLPRPARMVQDSHTARVAFTTPDGVDHEVPFHYPGEGGDRYVVGQRVTVVYQRSNPRNAVIDEGCANYTDMIFATVVVVGLAIWYAVDRLSSAAG